MGSLLDPVLSPLLSLDPLLAIAIVSFVISILIALVTKYFTNQTAMHEIKQEMKDLQTKAKAEKDNPQKAMALQKQAMSKNMDYMKHSMKSTLITIIPIMLIFGWLSANLAYMPLSPDNEFTVTMNFAKKSTGEVELIPPDEIIVLSSNPVEIVNEKAEWVLRGGTTDSLLQFNYNERYFDKDVIITDGKEYAEVVKKIKDPNVKSIKLSNDKVTPIEIGGLKLSWIWTYLIFSLIFSMSLRKLLKLH